MPKTSEDKERDANKLGLAVVFVLTVLLCSVIGFGFGRFDMQKEAVQHGHADFVVDQNTNMVFKWRAAK